MVHFMLTADGTLMLWCPTTLSCIIDSHQIHFPGGAITLDLVRRVEIYSDDMKCRLVAAEAHAWPVEEKEVYLTNKERRMLKALAQEARKEPPLFPIEQ
jgi:hypothetical protein